MVFKTEPRQVLCLNSILLYGTLKPIVRPSEHGPWSRVLFYYIDISVQKKIVKDITDLRTIKLLKL